MSVLIKSMKMPENCDVCQFSDWSNLHQTASCKVMDYSPCFSDYSREYEYKRSELCPLIELPKKHGRLVDADKLWKKMSKYTDNEGAKMPFGDDDSMIHKDSACFMIESADTIIEAEGEG